MNEAQALRKLKNGSEDALAWFIDRYSSYVHTVVGNLIGQSMSYADIEEVDADVFVTLWKRAQQVRAGSVKSWLGSVARNAAKNKLRELGQELPLEDDEIALECATPETEVERREQQRLVREAVLSMCWPEREIFLRHYYYGQKVSVIAEEMAMNLSTVKTHLRRGREKLRGVLSRDFEQEGDAENAKCQNL